jgi:hypothetical protein
MFETTDTPMTIADTKPKTPIAGRCERCEWETTTSSHAAMVKAYQDHLREAHPKIWLRT